MNYFELQENIEKLYPGKNARLLLDDDCIKKYEVMKCEGKFFPTVYVEYQHVKVQADGQEDILMPMKPHRANMTYKDFVELSPLSQEVYINERDLMELEASFARLQKDPSNQEEIKFFDDKAQMLSNLCWKSKEDIKALVNA